MTTTHHEILKAIGDLRQDVGRVEGKIEGYQAKSDEQDSRINGHAVRINKLEKRQSWFLGAGAAAGAAIAGAIELIKYTKT